MTTPDRQDLTRAAYDVIAESERQMDNQGEQPTDTREGLVQAAALILREIARLDATAQEDRA